MIRHFGSYQEGRGLYQDPLSPDQGNLGGLMAMGAMSALFYTPIGKGIASLAIKGFKGIGKGITSITPALGKATAFKASPVLARAAWRSIGGVGRGARTLARPIEWAGRRPLAATALGIGAATIFGGMRGFSSRPPFRNTTTETISFDESMKRGLPHDNLGATGDLTLALHGRR